MRTVYGWVLLTLLIGVNARAEAELPEEFYAAAPKMQLYLAYAEFKMAHYDTAHDMWQTIYARGNGEAAFNLGILYEQGMGVEKDLSQALNFYLKAAEHGSRAGAYQVGLMHLNHPDMISADTALHWLTIAALDGDTDAAALIESIQTGHPTEGDAMLTVRQLIAKGELDEALSKLIELSEMDPPNLVAITRLAWLYEAGLGVEQDISRAGELFQVAAEGGDAEAQYALSVMYETGVGRPKNSDTSMHWLRMSAEQHYQPAVTKLAPAD